MEKKRPEISWLSYVFNCKSIEKLTRVNANNSREVLQHTVAAATALRSVTMQIGSRLTEKTEYQFISDPEFQQRKNQVFRKFRLCLNTIKIAIVMSYYEWYHRIVINSDK